MHSIKVRKRESNIGQFRDSGFWGLKSWTPPSALYRREGRGKQLIQKEHHSPKYYITWILLGILPIIQVEFFLPGEVNFSESQFPYLKNG